MLRGLIIITLILSFGICIKAQEKINFFPKMLQKELHVENGGEIEAKEITMPENISRQIYLGRFYTLSHVGGTYKYYYIGRVKTCRAGGCSIVQKSDGDSETEYFDYFIIYDSMCAVQKVGVYNYQATHGHGVTAKGWLKQFNGYRGNDAQKKVDAISGATISVDAITFDIEHKTGLIQQLVSITSSR